MPSLERLTRALPTVALVLAGAVAAAALASGRWDPAWLRVAPTPIADLGSATTLAVPVIEGGFRAEQQEPGGRLVWRLTGRRLRSLSIREHELDAPRLELWSDGAASGAAVASDPPLLVTAREARVLLRDPGDAEGNPSRTRVEVELRGEVAAVVSGARLLTELALLVLAEPVDDPATPLDEGQRRWTLEAPGPVRVGGAQGAWQLELEASGAVARSHPRELRLAGPVRVHGREPASPALALGNELSGTLEGVLLRELLLPDGRPGERMHLDLSGPDLVRSGAETGALAAGRVGLDLRRDPDTARAALGGLAGVPPGPRFELGGRRWWIERGEADRVTRAETARVDSRGVIARSRVGLAGERVELESARDGPGGRLRAMGAAVARAGDDQLAARLLDLRWRGATAEARAEGEVSWERRELRDGREELHQLQADRVEARLVPWRSSWEAERTRRRALRREGVRWVAPTTLPGLLAEGNVRLAGPARLAGTCDRASWDESGLLVLEALPGRPPARLAGEEGELSARTLAAWQAGVAAGPLWVVAASGAVEARGSFRAGGSSAPAARSLPLTGRAGWLLALLREGPGRRAIPLGVVGGGGIELAEQGGLLRASGASLSGGGGPRGPRMVLRGQPGQPVRLDHGATAILAPRAQLGLDPRGEALELEAEQGWQAKFLLGPAGAGRAASADGERLWLQVDLARLPAADPRAGPRDPAAASRLLRALRASGRLRLDGAGLTARADEAELDPRTRALHLRGSPARSVQEGIETVAREVVVRLEE